MRIGNKYIGEKHPCFIVAEIGNNHNGSMEIAKRLIDYAKEFGIDAVKFQKRTVTEFLIEERLDMPYISSTSLGRTYREHREKLEFSEKQYRELSEYCRKKDIIFFATPFDEKSADFLETLDVPLYKIASFHVTHRPLLECVAKKKKPVIISTGMSTLRDVEDAVKIIRKYNDQLVLLHCVSSYPCDCENINLNFMQTLKRKFKLPVGYSGHERDTIVSVVAASLGAVVIERHFTLDRTMKGPDHASSLELGQFCQMVKEIRIVEKAKGNSYKKQILECENENAKKYRVSIVSKSFIPKGTRITSEMLTIKSPGCGIHPRQVSDIIGKKAKRNIEEDKLISMENLE